MKNRIAKLFNEPSSEERETPTDNAHRIDEVLEELFTDYERRFPNVRIAIVETPVSAF